MENACEMIQATHAPLLPAYPGFPEVRAERVTVLCEGPSAFHASQDELQAACAGGPVIAINRAIAFSDRVPIDFWATYDDPRNLWEWAQPHLHSKTKLFTSEDKVIVWDTLLPDFERLYAWHPTSMDGGDVEPDANGLYPLMPTIFSTLAWLLKLQVQEVVLVGVDMAGKGTPFLGDWDEDSDEMHECRWAVERVFLAHSSRFYRAKGARIKRWDKSRNRTR